MEYCGLLLMIMDYGLWWIIMEYGLSWIIVDEWGVSWVMDYMDYCGLLCTIVAQCGLSWIIVDSKKMHGLEDMILRPLTTPKRYGAGMAHTVVSIGFIDYCRLSCTAWRITVDYWYGRSWAIMDYCGFWTIMVLSLILDYHCSIVDSGLSWYMMDCRGLWTIMHYLELPYPGLLWII